MKSVQTGMTVSLNVVWAEDFWQADGVVFGWNAEAAWEGGAFTATVSPSELLPEGLPTYTLDSRDLERLMLLVGGLFETVPEDALSFSGGSLMGRGYSFRIDTERLRGYIDRKMPIYLKSHETEINALVEKYMPFLTLFSPQAEQWGDAAWLSNRMYRLAEMLPRNFRAEVTLARSWFAGNWQLDAVVNEYTLSASVGYGNVTAILSVSDDYGVYSYKLDARLTESGAEMVCGVTEDGRTQQLTVCLIEETDGYLVEAYTEKERFYASLRLEEKEARLEVSEYGQRVATGSVKVAGNYVYVDWISDELTLDGTLIVGDGTYAMTLLVNGYPVTAKLELPNYYWGGAFECHSDGIDLEAEVGHYGMRLYADARGIFNSRKENALLLEILPLQNRYGFVVKEYAKSSPGALMDLAEYGFTYSTGRLSIMKGRQTVTVSDVTAWTDGCLNAVDVTVFDMLRGIGQSVRVITRAEGSDVLIADVYAEGADEAALTVTIRRRIEPMNLPEPDSWLSAEEFLKMMGY